MAEDRRVAGGLKERGMPQAELILGVLVEGRGLRPSLGANYEYVKIYFIFYYFYYQALIILTFLVQKPLVNGSFLFT